MKGIPLHHQETYHSLPAPLATYFQVRQSTNTITPHRLLDLAASAPAPLLDKDQRDLITRFLHQGKRAKLVALATDQAKQDRVAQIYSAASPQLRPHQPSLLNALTSRALVFPSRQDPSARLGIGVLQNCTEAQAASTPPPNGQSPCVLVRKGG